VVFGGDRQSGVALWLNQDIVSLGPFSPGARERLTLAFEELLIVVSIVVPGVLFSGLA
jgi:hypothetical protein